MNMLEVARAYVAAGLSVLPIRSGGKAPAVSQWREYQNRLPTDEELVLWYGEDNLNDYGIALIGGKVSGNLEILDWDSREDFFRFFRLSDETPELKSIVDKLPALITPSGGAHFYYRCEVPIPGNIKLARGKDNQIIAETRGEGGYAITAPTKGYGSTSRGKITNLPTLTQQERELLHRYVKSFNQYVEAARIKGESTSKPTDGRLRPGDDYNERGDVEELLREHGWEEVGERGDVIHWKRPGKSEEGLSATFGIGGTRLFYVFSSNAAPFENDKAYTPFAVYALLEYEGDFSAAASELSRQGYGDPLEEHDLPYRETPQGLIWNKLVREDIQPIPLTNFTARIVGEIEEDDGSEDVRRFYQIETQKKGKVKLLTISDKDFEGLAWKSQLGSNAVVYPGNGVKDHTATAIRLVSGEPPLEKVFAHTGWRKVDKTWFYLHAGGAIGTADTSGLTVRLRSLPHYILPEPPSGESRIEAIRASLQILDFGIDTLTIPLLASVYRAAMGVADFSLHLWGTTGVFKSQLAALVQQHFGAEMNGNHLPAAWSSTDNALEALAFLAKDAVLTIDDFNPIGGQVDVKRWHSKADRVFRSQGNGSGRQRMRPDTSLRGSKEPRGLLLSTGEDIPNGQSLRARLVILEVTKGAVDKGVLTARQREAEAGLYASALSAFIEWLAPQYDTVRQNLKPQASKMRDILQLGQSGHKRAGMNMGHLALGWSTFLEFAQETGAITEKDRLNLEERAWKAFQQIALDQEKYQTISEPAEQFLSFLRTALMSKKAYVAAFDFPHKEPAQPQHWGWQAGDYGWQEHGDRIGWIDEEGNLYLDPEASYAVARRIGEASDNGLTKTKIAIHKQLHEKGKLRSTDPKRETLLCRKSIAGKGYNVLHLHSLDIYPEAEAGED